MGSGSGMWWRNSGIYRADTLMKIKTLEEILEKKSSKTEFAILTNLENGE